MWATSIIFKILPKVNNHLLGESGHPEVFKKDESRSLSKAFSATFYSFQVPQQKEKVSLDGL
jgi:hypothetical protein